MILECYDLTPELAYKRFFHTAASFNIARPHFTIMHFPVKVYIN